MSEEYSTVELVDEDGEHMLFTHLMTLDYKDNRYVLLSPEEEADEDEDGEEEVVILRVTQDENGEDVYENIEDDALLDEVFDAFVEVSNLYDDEDEEDEDE
jgi:uncharacterized protein YrzB (UPF0473 family)